MKKYLTIIGFILYPSLMLFAQQKTKLVIPDSSKKVLITLVTEQAIEGYIISRSFDTLFVRTERNGSMFIKTKNIQDIETLETENNPSKSTIQKPDPRSLRPFGFGVNLGGPTLSGSVNIDYFLTPNLSGEVGGGGFGWWGFYGGAKLYAPINKLAFYTGLTGGFINLGGGDRLVYVPFGINYTDVRGFSVSVELAKYKSIEFKGSRFQSWAQLRIGHRFKKG